MCRFEHVNTILSKDLLKATLDESDLLLMIFENQVVGDSSVPDATIRSSTSLWFETMTRTDKVDLDQVHSHFDGFDEEATPSGSWC